MVINCLHRDFELLNHDDHLDSEAQPELLLEDLTEDPAQRKRSGKIFDGELAAIGANSVWKSGGCEQRTGAIRIVAHHIVSSAVDDDRKAREGWIPWHRRHEALGRLAFGPKEPGQLFFVNRHIQSV